MSLVETEWLEKNLDSVNIQSVYFTDIDKKNRNITLNIIFDNNVPNYKEVIPSFANFFLSKMNSINAKFYFEFIDFYKTNFQNNLKNRINFLKHENIQELNQYKKTIEKILTFVNEQLELSITNNLSFILGGEYKNQKGMGIGTDYTESMDNWAHYIHATYDYQDPGNAYKNILLMGGYRSDDHTSWGEEITYKFKVGYHLPKTNTSFHTSYATAFRAPSLDQLYSQSGGGAFSNSSLLPETSKNFEFGIKQKVNDRSSMTMTFYNSSCPHKLCQGQNITLFFENYLTIDPLFYFPCFLDGDY